MANKKKTKKSGRSSSKAVPSQAAKETLDYVEARVARNENNFWQIVRSGSIMVSIFAGAPVVLLIRSEGESRLVMAVVVFALAAAYGATLFYSRALSNFRSRLRELYRLRDIAETAFLKNRPQGEHLKQQMPPIGSGVMRAFVGASEFIRFAFGISAILCLISFAIERDQDRLIWRPDVWLVVVCLAALVTFGALEVYERKDSKPPAD